MSDNDTKFNVVFMDMPKTRVYLLVVTKEDWIPLWEKFEKEMKGEENGL